MNPSDDGPMKDDKTSVPPFVRRGSWRKKTCSCLALGMKHRPEQCAWIRAQSQQFWSELWPEQQDPHQV